VKSLLWLTELVLQDCGTMCGVDPTRDLKTVISRCEHEGDEFLTITLPAFCSAFEAALDSGRLEPSMTPGFAWNRRGLPAFLRGFLLQVFNTQGLILESASIAAISCVRQICLLHKKVLRPCKESRNVGAIRGFKATEHDLRLHERENMALAPEMAFDYVSRIVWADIVKNVPFGDPRDEIIPGHGPGATQEKLSGNKKFQNLRWHQRLENVFPFSEYGVASLRSPDRWKDDALDVEIVSPRNEAPVRVTLVPKTLKTPRVIAIEPVCVQYMQQGLMKFLVPLIEKGRFTGGHVGFTDQSINGRLALQASKDGKLATIDLSEASDRVSSKRVWRMLSSVPRLREQIFACRSTRAELPDGDVVTLRKFASMGSALCFPMEAMVFFCTIVAKRLVMSQKPWTVARIKALSRDVYVYGDDIIVPVSEAPSICAGLESIGLKVNRRKSFWTGKFRESCGTDAFDGHRVTPVYVRKDLPSDRADSSGIVSATSLSNQFYLAGLWRAADAVKSLVERLVGRLPLVGTTPSGLGWKTFSNASTLSRWNDNLHRWEHSTLVVTPKRRVDPLTGDRALLKVLLELNRGILERAEKGLEESVMRGVIALKRRWVSSY